jgi:hypothetical protein
MPNSKTNFTNYCIREPNLYCNGGLTLLDIEDLSINRFQI